MFHTDIHNFELICFTHLPLSRLFHVYENPIAELHNIAS